MNVTVEEMVKRIEEMHEISIDQMRDAKGPYATARAQGRCKVLHELTTLHEDIHNDNEDEDED